jgi:hypothetical protein
MPPLIELPASQLDGSNRVIDYFGNPLIYFTDGTEFQILSAGRDGKMGTDDDLSSHREGALRRTQ